MPTINIVFRGLMVLNKHQVNGNPSMEIGILEAHEHTPRIMTFRNGVREETMLIDLERPPLVWKLMVDDPVANNRGITTREHGRGPINRMGTATPDDDFRWIVNLENNEFPYGNINTTYGLDRTEIKHVLQITSGEFYTRLKSPLLRRRENTGPQLDFGAIAGVTGLEIQVSSGGAKLIGENDDDVIFRFSSDANVMYEIANSPADTVATAPDHFHHYYDIFQTQPAEKYVFSRRPLIGGANPPGPNPALCGKGFLGAFDGSLDPEDTSKETTSSSTSTSTSTCEHTEANYDATKEKQVTAAN